MSVEAPRESSLLRNADESLAFDLTAEQREILDQADRFGRRELYPLAERMDAEEYWPEDAFPKIGEAGFFGVTVPESYGGVGADLVAGVAGDADVVATLESELDVTDLEELAAAFLGILAGCLEDLINEVVGDLENGLWWS